MKELTVERLIGAPRAKVWEIASDVGRVDVYHPMVETSVCTTAAPRGVGAARRCNFYEGKGQVEEVVTSWSEGRSFTLAVVRGTMPFKKAEARFDFSEAGPDRTWVRITMRYAMKGGLLGELFGSLMMAPMMRKMLGGVLAGLDTHSRTGQRIGYKGVAMSA